LQAQLSRKELYNFEALREALRTEIKSIVGSVNSGEIIDHPKLSVEKRVGPIIWLVVGVNGAGKTTTIGKLAGWTCAQDLKVMVAAGDTFRAAAGSQLAVWSERAKVEIFEGDANAKPSGVAFDACQKAIKENFDLLIIDTAGRLHTQANLMEELAKIKRVIEKAAPGAPHETLLVLDANNGQNALVQAKQFHQALGVTGVILTKLDGTAKGGVVVGLAHELRLPVLAIGVGEKMGDLRGFSTSEFVDSLL
jgi:fused signal recognition particle receptor